MDLRVVFAALLLFGQGIPTAQAVAQSPSGDATRQAFAAADLDGDGVVDEAEVVNDAIVGFVATDTDGDGLISAPDLEEADRAALPGLDANGDGRLDFSEMIARKLAQFAAADTDGDGVLSLEEVLAGEGVK